jgi:hypothetical protein
MKRAQKLNMSTKRMLQIRTLEKLLYAKKFKIPSTAKIKVGQVPG